MSSVFNFVRDQVRTNYDHFIGDQMDAQTLYRLTEQVKRDYGKDARVEFDTLTNTVNVTGAVVVVQPPDYVALNTWAKDWSFFGKPQMVEPTEDISNPEIFFDD